MTIWLPAGVAPLVDGFRTEQVGVVAAARDIQVIPRDGHINRGGPGRGLFEALPRVAEAGVVRKRGYGNSALDFVGGIMTGAEHGKHLIIGYQP